MTHLRNFVLAGAVMLLPACATAPEKTPATESSAMAAPALTNPPGSLQLGDDPQRVEMLPERELDPETHFRLLLAEMLLNRKQYDQAAGIYLQLARTIHDPRLVRRAAQVSLLASDPSLLAESSRLWIADDEEDIGAWQMLTIARTRQGDVDGAVNALERADNWPGDVDLAQRYSWYTSMIPPGRQSVEIASQVFGRYLERHPEALAARFAYAHLVSRLGRAEEALQEIEGVLAQRPDLYPAIVMKVRLLQLLSRQQEALDYLQARVEANPGEDALRLLLARLLMENGRYEEALADFTRLVEDHPDDTDIVYALAVLNLQLQHLDEAETYLKRLQAMGRHRDEVSFYLGWLAEKRQQWPLAIAYYAAVGQSANFVEARTRQAILIAKQGGLAGARRLLAELRDKFHAEGKRLFLVEAELLASSQQVADAMAIYATALEQYPDDIDILYARAMLAERQGNLQVFEDDMRAILRQSPDNINALNALGYTLADRTDRYQEAYDYIRRAYDQSPDNNAILDSMGWVLYKLGRMDEALSFLQQSLDRRMDNEVAAHLGEVLWVAGKQAQAREVWDKALKEFPDDDVLLETIRRLQP